MDADAEVRAALDPSVKRLGELGEAASSWRRSVCAGAGHCLPPSAEYYTQTGRDRRHVRIAGRVAGGAGSAPAGAGPRRDDAGRAALAAVLVLFALAVWHGLRTASAIHRELGAEPAELRTLAQRVSQGDLGSRLPLASGDNNSLAAAPAGHAGNWRRPCSRCG